MLKTILFDAAGTLFRLRQSVGQTYADFAERFGGNIDAVAAENAFRRAMRSRPAPADRSDHRDWWRALVFDVFAGSARSDGGFDRDPCFDALFTHFATAEAWQLYPEVRDVLAAFRQAECRLGIVSNFDRRLGPLVSEFGLSEHFDAVVFSGAVGAVKPDAEIFRAALAALDATPDATLHIGDDPRCDWEGARRAGLHAFELRRPENTLRDALSLLP